MAKKDFYSKGKPVVALAPKVISSNTTTAGLAIDTAGFESVTFYPMTGVLTDGDYTILIEESDVSGSGYTAVADADLLGLEANSSFTDDTDDAQIGKIGYIGDKRYVKASVVSANVTTGSLYGIIAVLSDAFVQPVAYTAQT